MSVRENLFSRGDTSSHPTRRVGRRDGGVEGAGVNHTGAAVSADLGSSSK